MAEDKARLRARRAKKKELESAIERLLYWASLLVLVFLNILGCFFLIPFLLFFRGFALYAAVGAFSLVMGLLFNFLVLGLERLERRHHIVAGILVPLLALLDIALILGIAEHLNRTLLLNMQFNVAGFILLFVALFVTPYLLSVVLGRHKI